MSDQKDLKSSGFCASSEEAPPTVISLSQPASRLARPALRGWPIPVVR